MATSRMDGGADALTNGTESQIPDASTININRLNSLVDDDAFHLLRQHFLRPPGRGRPVDLPTVSMTHRLLVQLYLLKEEDEHATFADLQRWLCKLIPTVQGVTKSRVTHHATSVFKQCLKMTELEAGTFLDQSFDFHALPPSLASLGLDRIKLLNFNFEHVGLPSDNTITNQVVRDLEHFQAQENLPMSFVVKWIVILSPVFSTMNVSQVRSKVLSVCKKIRTMVKNKKTTELAEFLVMPFQLPSHSHIPKSHSNSNSNSTVAGDCNRLEKANKKLESVVEKQQIHISVLEDKCKDLQNQKDENDQVKTELKDKVKENKSLKSQLNVTQMELNKVSQTRTYKENTALRKKLESKSNTLEKVRADNKVIRDEVRTSKHELKLAQTAKSNLKTKFEKEKEKCKALAEEFQHQGAGDNLDFSLKCEDSRRFKDPVRLAYMELQGKAEVAASKCSQVVQIVGKHIFGHAYTEEELPSSSSAINFADEGHHISMHQVVDSIKKSDHYTYASDGTSRQKRQYVERHVILADKTQLSVGFTEIACDDAKTLLEQAVEMLQELSHIYNLGDDSAAKEETFKELLSKMKCLMSDRAAVNKLFNKRMSEFKQNCLEDESTVTHFLYCNAHWLLGAGRSTEEAVKEVEENCCLGRDTDMKFHSFSTSSESAALRLIRTASDSLGPRGDEKSGSRAEWLAFCDLNNITSKFTSYRSNRFNNLFENAAATLFHHQHIVSFLSSSCTHSNMKLQSVLADVSDEQILSIVGAIALFNLVFTECYWLLMNSHVPYAAFPQYVQKLDSAFEYFSDNIIEAQEVKPVFEDFPVKDTSTKLLLFSGNLSREKWGPVFQLIVQKARVVLKRQLNDFLDGGVFGGELDEETEKILNTCPLTNLSGERLFGDLDYDMLRRRHATTHHRSSVTMWKHNNTGKWFEKQSEVKRQSIMNDAIKNKSKLRQKHLDTIKKVREEIKQKLLDNQLKVKEKEIKTAQIKASILDGILAQGGVCQTAEDLQNLYKKCTTDDLKCQIRYRKVFLNDKTLRLSGTKEMLFKSLMKALEENGDCMLLGNDDSESEESDV